MAYPRGKQRGRYHRIPDVISLLGRTLFRITGWRLEGWPPDLSHYVLIGYPHTSNWDFILFLMAYPMLGRRFRFMGKDALFKPFWGWFMRAVGGIAIDRSGGLNTVDAMVRQVKASEQMALIVAPEGTRKHTAQWRTGFYYIALGAEIPLVMAALNYREKTITVSEPKTLSGDFEADVAEIRAFFKGAVGRYPESEGGIVMEAS
jgi:1-acyl-sn-glycerol-3-phosphate acyltransferase